MLYNSFFKTKNQSPHNGRTKPQMRQSSIEKAKKDRPRPQLSSKIDQFEKEAIVSMMNSKKKSVSKRLKTEQGMDTLDDYLYLDSYITNKQSKSRSFSNAFTSTKSADRKNNILNNTSKRQKSSSQKHSLEDDTGPDNFPLQFQKIKLLGKGGFSLVWLGEHKTTKMRVAIKQIKQSTTNQTYLREIWFGSHFFDNGIPKPQLKSTLGIKSLVQYLGFEIGSTDTWIFTEVCGENLKNTLYELKGQQIKNEIVYKMIQKPLYISLKQDLNILKRIIKDVAHALILLTEQRIVHCDLKTENILIKKSKCLNGSYQITQTKLIDYGSSFIFDDLSQFSMATPEYMSPEILNYVLYENGKDYDVKLFKVLQNYYKPWVIDIWSLGCVILEIVYGIPLWLNNKIIVKHHNKEVIEQGLFAVKNRAFDQIINKQIHVVKNLDYYLDNNYSGIKVDLEIRLLLREMLTIDPDKRIAPHTIIEFLQPTKGRLKTE
ncbi:unnamed protein product (macronuclear) [Paramecium tetraurelia]|uniref:Protein kinase domain-containing protein n=1 Tax=Paramecium tetraurelia TaxID=5888 RepID=A0C7E9_PARTE|nr:uncharacterized protein GSPATT00035846001 [Paramecium tetraurelia]CAK66716.1 unnamed protein product [Paramecium tetraurelia]|eukprot:XP_001434113.1 hypothetical protein (macronuclear) [Paramecium tetraurelia strain d4-2]